ncbi:MAG: hypothetical protein KGL53_06255, partial [Elusimicrobia bacterium]|nr:hypothetical protein [Elusimicrobiota bacterium]
AARPPTDGPAAAGGDAPYDLKARPLDKTVLSDLLQLCWTPDGSGRRLLDERGAPLTEGEVDAFLEPFDAEAHPLTPEQRQGYVESRCRIDGAAVLCLDAAGKPERLRNIDEAVTRRKKDLQQAKDVADRVGRYLASRRPPDAPLTDQDVAAIRGLVYNMTGKKELPAALDVKHALRAGIPPSALAGGLARASQSLGEFFDRNGSIKSLASAGSFRSVGTGEWKSPSDSMYFGAPERALGDRMQGAFAARLAQNPVGRELLARFGTGDQKPKLPAFLVAPLGSFAGAEYDPGRNTVIINSDKLLDAPQFARLAPERRDALKADASLLSAYLLKHPGEVDAYV